MEDGELIQRHAATRDEAAFAELVRRYAGLVRGTCLRVLGDPSLADDATQATFLVLARRAGSLGRQPSLAGWLHRTAELTARAMQREVRRRRQREQAVAIPEEATMPEAEHGSSWSDLMPHLDAALAALPAIYREVVVLRYLEGRSEGEICTNLQLSRSVVSVRHTRAMAMLRSRLDRRGVAVPAVALSGLLAAHGVHVAPPATVAAVQAACSGQATSLAATRLAENTMRLIFWNSMKLPIACAVAAIAGLLAVPALVRVMAVEPPPPIAAAPPPLVVKLADQARGPVWSPGGAGIAWIAEIPRPVEEREGGGTWGPGSWSLALSQPVASSGVGIADPLAGPPRTLVLVRDALPVRGLAWTPDAGAVLAWDERQVWRIPAAGNPLQATVLLRAEGERRIDSVVLAPDGANLLVICTSPAAAGMRDGREIVIHAADGTRRASVIGRQPLWSPDGRTVYASRGDQLCRITVATGAIEDLLSAGYYLTHPFPKAVEPPAGMAHELWPVVVLRDGWLVFDMIEVSVRAGHFGTYAFHGERVLWKPAAAMVNNRLTDHFEGFSEIGRRGERARIAMTPLDDQGRFLRIEEDADPDVRLGRVDYSGRLQRTLAMTVDARAGAILAIHDLPPSSRIDREIRSANGIRHELDADAVRWHLDGVQGRQALFRFVGWTGGDQSVDPRSGQGLLWLDTATGDRRWLELPAESFPRRGSCSAVPSPAGNRAAVVQVTGSAGQGVAACSLWLASPDPAQTRPPMAVPYHAVVQVQGDQPRMRTSAVVVPTGEAPPPPQPGF